MKKKLLCSFLITSLLSCSGTESIAETIPPDVKKVVTFIFKADKLGKLFLDPKSNRPVPIGTGFFVAAKGELATAPLYQYLVTAKHVLKDSDETYFGKVFLRINKRVGDADFVPLDLTKDGKRLIFTDDSDDSVDIAVVPCRPDSQIFDFKVIPEEMVTTEQSFQTSNIAEGSDIFFAGLYTGYYGSKRNMPIVRFGRVSMIPEDRIQFEPNKPPEQLYMLETQSYGGNSGSPVFFSLGADRTPGTLTIGPADIKLAGIMKGYFGDWSPIKLVQTAPGLPPPAVPAANQNIGIAAVTPAYFLHQIGCF